MCVELVNQWMNKNINKSTIYLNFYYIDELFGINKTMRLPISNLKQKI